MPKKKTHSGTKKRFKVTGSGKLLRQQRQPPPPARAQAEHAAPAGWPARPRSSPADAKRDQEAARPLTVRPPAAHDPSDADDEEYQWHA